MTAQPPIFAETPSCMQAEAHLSGFIILLGSGPSLHDVMEATLASTAEDVVSTSLQTQSQVGPLPLPSDTPTPPWPAVPYWASEIQY